MQFTINLLRFKYKSLNVNAREGTYSDGGEQPLGYVGDDDADEEHNGVEPVVLEREREEEEGDAEEHGDRRDDVDEVGDLARDGRLARLERRGEVRDASHHRVVAAVDHHSAAGACAQHEREHE